MNHTSNFRTSMGSVQNDITTIQWNNQSDDGLSEGDKKALERFLEVTSMMFLMKRDPFALFTVIGPGIAYLVVVFNIFVVIVFIRSRKQTPLHILMIVLAISDAFESICRQGLEPIAFLKYTYVEDIDIDNIQTLPFPFCYVYYTSVLLSDCFRMCSVFITNIIGVQRIIAIKFPFWARQHLTNKTTIMMIVVAVCVSVTIQLPRHFGIILKSKLNKDVCLVDTFSFRMIKYNLELYPLILWSLFLASILTLSTSAAYIIWLLFKKMPGLSGQPTQFQHTKRKTAILVVTIVIIFVISEGPRTLLYTILLVNPITAELEFDTTQRLVMCDPMSFLYSAFYTSSLSALDMAEFRLCYQIIIIITAIGCAANFFVYVIVSEEVRKALSVIFCCKCYVVKRKSLHVIESTRL